MQCKRCGRVFTVKAGHVIAHDRRQGAVYVNCDGDLAADVPRGSRSGVEATRGIDKPNE